MPIDRENLRKAVPAINRAKLLRKQEVSIDIYPKGLTLEEAAAYSGIGINKIRESTNDEHCKFVLWVGNKRVMKRQQFDANIEQAYTI